MTFTTDSRSMRSRSAGSCGQGRVAGPLHQVDRGDQLGRARWTGPRRRPPGCARGRWRRCSSEGGGHARVGAQATIAIRCAPVRIAELLSGHDDSYRLAQQDLAAHPAPASEPHRQPSRTRNDSHCRKVVTLSSNGQQPTKPDPGVAGLPEGFLFGVATAGFQVEGGYNGPGEPANNWSAGSRWAGSSRRGTPWASGTGPRSRWTVPPGWAATASA